VWYATKLADGKKKIASSRSFLKPSDLRRAILATERFLLYKKSGVGCNNQVGAKSMPQLDFRQALSSPEEKPIPSAEAVQSAPPRSLAGAPADQSKDLIGRVRLSRSQMTNISFVTIACVGGLACAFYFFNGAEFLRAAAAWAGEFLYPRPSAVAANVDISKQQNSPNQAANAGTPSQGPDRPSPFDKSIWPSNLNQPATFANVSPSGTVSPSSTNSPNSPFSGVGSLVNGLNLLPRGADTLFQSFYQTAISMAPKKVTRTVSRTAASARNKISRAQQNAAAAAAQANAAAAASKSAGRSAQQTANAQNQAAIMAARAQSQSLMGGFQGGAPLGGGTGLGGMGGIGGGAGSGLGGIVSGLGRH
jgi:hypothetical protein